MLDVQVSGSLACVVKTAVEEVHGLSRQILFAPKQLCRSQLSLVSADVGGLILEVEDEPQFNAGIGNGQADPIVFRFLDSLPHVRMRIDIEYAPDLIMSPSSASPLVTQLCLPRRDGPLNE